LSVKGGHFYSVVGYEGLPATGNFFYTKSYSYMFAGPFQHWGGIATWNPVENLSFDMGVVNGWDALDRLNDRANYMGRVRLGQTDGPIWTSFAIITGDDLNFPLAAQIPAAENVTTRKRYSWLVGMNPTCRLEYIFHQWAGWQENYFGPNQDAGWYGVDQYLYYRLTNTVRLGGRFEWFRDDDGVRVGLSRPDNPNRTGHIGNFYCLSTGLNWTPYENLMVRPELRYDWFDSDEGYASQPYDDGNRINQFLAGLDVIYSF